MKIIDISQEIYQGMPVYPGDPTFQSHRVNSFKQGDMCEVSEVTMGTHCGTHIDAPTHMVPDGKPLESFPLDCFIGPCRVLNVPYPVISEKALQELNVQPGERILLRTDPNGKYNKHARFNPSVLSMRAAQYLAQLPVKLVGIDAPTVENMELCDGEVHAALLKAGIPLLEGLRLEEADKENYELSALPIRLMGENGAGKSTLIKTLSGAIQPNDGEIVFEGTTYTHMEPHQAMELGIHVIYQEFNMMPELSVAENIFMGQQLGGGVLFNKSEKKLVCYPYAFTQTSYTIPDGIRSIGDRAFSSCNVLTSITIPNSVTSIGKPAYSVRIGRFLTCTHSSGSPSMDIPSVKVELRKISPFSNEYAFFSVHPVIMIILIASIITTRRDLFFFILLIRNIAHFRLDRSVIKTNFRYTGHLPMRNEFSRYSTH